MAGYFLGDQAAKLFPVYRQRSSGGQGGGFGALEQQGAHAFELVLQQACAPVDEV